MKKAAVIIAVMMGLSLAMAQEQVGPPWPTDKYKAFEESKKKNRLIFLYYTSKT